MIARSYADRRSARERPGLTGPRSGTLIGSGESGLINALDRERARYHESRRPRCSPGCWKGRASSRSGRLRPSSHHKRSEALEIMTSCARNLTSSTSCRSSSAAELNGRIDSICLVPRSALL